jgi:hypothetical protein
MGVEAFAIAATAGTFPWLRNSRVAKSFAQNDKKIGFGGGLGAIAECPLSNCSTFGTACIEICA